MTTNDTLRVFIRDCRVRWPVGVYAFEQKGPQEVLANVELETDAPHYYRDPAERTLERVIDYEALYRFLAEEIPSLGHVYLLETLAEQVLAFCFRDVRVKAARVRLEKTEIFPSAAGAGIELYRTRSVA